MDKSSSVPKYIPLVEPSLKPILSPQDTQPFALTTPENVETPLAVISLV